MPARSLQPATAETDATQPHTTAPAVDSPNAASPRSAAQTIIGHGVAQIVGLVVHHHIPRLAQPQHHIDRARTGIRAAAGRPARPTSAGRRTTPAGHRTAGAGAAAHPRRTRQIRSRAAKIASGQRDLEVQFPQPVPHADLPQRHAGANGPSGVSCIGTIAAARSARRRRPATTRVASHLFLEFDSKVGAPKDRRSRALRAPAIRTRHRRACQPSERRRSRRVLGTVIVTDLVIPHGYLRLAFDADGLGDHGSAPSTRCAATGVDARWKWRTAKRDGPRGGQPIGATITDSSTDRAARGLPLFEPCHRVVVGDSRGASVRYLRPRRAAAAQQPRQPAVGFVPGRRPPRHDLGLCPGQRDVGHSAVVAGILTAVQLFDRLPFGAGLCRRCTGSECRRRRDTAGCRRCGRTG